MGKSCSLKSFGRTTYRRFLTAVYLNKDEQHYNAIKALIQRCNTGGLLFFQGTSSNQVVLINRYQQVSQTPSLIATDVECGLGMRLGIPSAIQEDTFWRNPR